MTPSPPIPPALVQWFLFGDRAAARDDPASMLVSLTESQRRQARWNIESRILRERGIISLKMRLQKIGKREHGPAFESDKDPALSDAVRSDVKESDVIAVAKTIFEQMTPEQKREFYPPR